MFLLTLAATMCSCFGFVLAQYHAGFEICINSNVKSAHTQILWVGAQSFIVQPIAPMSGCANEIGDPALLHGNPAANHQ
jgi:hypothetical protein